MPDTPRPPPNPAPERRRRPADPALSAAPWFDDLISTAEAARQLGVSARTVRRYIHAGYLQAVRFGPKVFGVRSADVARLLTSPPRSRLEAGFPLTPPSSPGLHIVRLVRSPKPAGCNSC